MSRIFGAVLVLACLLTALPQAAAHQTVYATSSTGNVDTWGLPDPSGLTPGGMCGTQIGKIHFEHICPPPVFGPCPQDIYFFTVRLELLDASPGDAVALTVVGDAWSLNELVHSSVPANDPVALVMALDTYPTEIATYDDPVAEIVVQLGGCNRATTAVVSGLVVDGEVSYKLTY